MRVALALLLLAFLAFWPYAQFPEWRGTEALRVQIAQEMVVSGDYMVPRLWGDPIFTKPPFYYWCLAAFNHAFGMHLLSMRLPSVLAFWLLALLAFRVLRPGHGLLTAWVGAVGILTSPLVLHDVPFAEIDPLFAALTGACVLLLTRASRNAFILAGILGGLAFLTKGPPLLMFLLGPYWVLWRMGRLGNCLKWMLPGLVLPSLAYSLALTEVKDMAEIASTESVGRMNDWSWRIFRKIPEYIFRALALTLPFGLWLPIWWRRMRAGKKVNALDMCVWSGLGAMLILLFYPARSSRYLLPAIPMIIAGLAPMVAGSQGLLSPLASQPRRVLAAIGALAALAMMAMPWLPYPYPGMTPIVLLAVALAPLLVQRRGGLLACMLLLPLLLAWFGFPDRIRYKDTAPGSSRHAGALLARELQKREVQVLQSRGLVAAQLLLASGMPVQGKADVSAEPSGAWVLYEDGGFPLPVQQVPGYRDVFRIQAGDKSLLIKAKK